MRHNYRRAQRSILTAIAEGYPDEAQRQKKELVDHFEAEVSQTRRDLSGSITTPEELDDIMAEYEKNLIRNFGGDPNNLSLNMPTH